MCNKTNRIDFTTIKVTYDNKSKFFCVKSRCLCCAIALQFPNVWYPFSFFFSVSPNLSCFTGSFVLSVRRPLSSRHTPSSLSQLQLPLPAHELFIPHAHLPLPGDAPPQYVILVESRDTHHPLPLLNSFALKHSYLINCSQCEEILVRWFN